MSLDQSPNGLNPDQIRLLDKLCAPLTTSGPRRVAPSGHLGMLGGILDEIDETVMARQLVLDNGVGGRLLLDVCNRRVLQVKFENNNGAELVLSARDLTYAGVEDLSTLRTTLEDFGTEGQITIHAAPAETMATLEDTGLAAATLRRSWSSETTEEPESALAPHDLERFCQVISPHVTAWLLSLADDDDAQAIGPEDEIDRLVGTMGSLDLADNPSQDDVCLTIYTNDDELLLIACADEAIALISCPAQALGTVLDAL